MKKFILGIALFLFAFGMFGCSQNKELTVVNTFEATPTEFIEEYTENAREVTTTTYYEMSDGTWKTDEYAYKYRLEVTGRLNHAAYDTTYIILSNREDISFEQAWKAGSGLSSNLDDYFDVEDTVIAAVKFEQGSH